MVLMAIWSMAKKKDTKQNVFSFQTLVIKREQLCTLAIQMVLLVTIGLPKSETIIALIKEAPYISISIPSKPCFLGVLIVI